MATTLEIINGISQAISRGYDGAHDESGEPIEIGLRREDGDPQAIVTGKQVVIYNK